MPPNASPALLRTLNDLLQLDQDALRSYQVAIDALSTETLKRRVRQFRRDHQRHVRELTELVREHGGTPVETPHLSTGLLKLAMQSLGAAGGDRAVLLAFRANEWESVAKYRRAAGRRYSAAVREVLRRGAQDEERHYRWAVEQLEKLGAGDDTVVGRIEQVLERVHGGAALGLEALERASVGAVRSRGSGSGSGSGSGAKKTAKKPAKKTPRAKKGGSGA